MKQATRPLVHPSKLTGIVALCLSLVIGFAAGARAAGYPPFDDVDLHASDFRGQAAPGSAVQAWVSSEPDLLGKVVVVEFWSTLAKPCLRAVPLLNAMQERYADDVTVIGLSPEPASVVKPYIEANNVRYTIAIDEQARLQSALGVNAIPTSIVMSADGVIRWQGAPWDLKEETLKQIIAANKEAAPQLERPLRVQAPRFPPFDPHVRLSALDIRGKRGPKLQVQKWMSDKPEIGDRITVVEFWATWCGPCRRSIPHMNELYEKLGKDVAFIGVSDEKPETVRSFLKSTAMNYAVAVDQSGAMKRYVGVRGIPHALVMSSDGVVRWQGHPMQLTAPVLRQIIVANRAIIAQRRAGRTTSRTPLPQKPLASSDPS